MDLLIYSMEDALRYDPVDNTYAIRIFHPRTKGNILYENMNLKDSQKYIDIKKYYFSDTWPGWFLEPGDVLFDKNHAKDILEDFINKKDICDTLMVHCSRGMNRSPAVAIALNEIFNLGHDTEELKKQYKQSTWHVYRTLLEVSKEYKK